MKTSPLQLFLVPKLSEVIKECSLNDFKPANHGPCVTSRQKMQTILRNAGIGFRQSTHYRFPSDAEMYVGFPCRGSAIRYSAAQEQGLQRRLLESNLAATRFIKQYKQDMSYETFPQPNEGVFQPETV